MVVVVAYSNPFVPTIVFECLMSIMGTELGKLLGSIFHSSNNTFCYANFKLQVFKFRASVDIQLEL